MSETFDLDLDEGHEPLCDFKLDNRIWHVCNGADIPLQTFAAAQEVGTDGGKFRVKLVPFFRAVIVPDERDDFMAMLERDGSPLTLSRAQKLIGYINEQLAGRPTQRSADSSVGSPTTQADSEVA